MSSLQHTASENQIQKCQTKRKYLNKAASVRQIAYILCTRKTKLRTYQCPLCGFWHLTSQM